MVRYRGIETPQWAKVWWLLLFVGTWSGCRAAPDKRGPIEVLATTEPVMLDPRYCTRALDLKLSRLEHAGLVGLDATTLEPEPLAAEALEQLDARHMRVTIKPGIRFHGGQPLSSEDVCATLQALADPALRSPYRSISRAFIACRIVGARVLELELGEPRATWMTDLEVPILRRDQARSSPQAEGGLDGLGPFTAHVRSPGVIEYLPANTGVLAQPKHPVVVRTVRDENARAMRLVAGRAEVAVNAISATLLEDLGERADLAVVSRPGANVTYLLVQNDRTPFTSPQVRRALSLAIDRVALVKYLLAGRGRSARWLIPPGHWAAPDDLPELPYAPSQARSVLSGFGPVTLLTSTDRSRVLMARAVSQMLGDAGLPTRVVPLDLGAMLARLDAGNFSLAILQIPELTEPNILKWFFDPAGIAGGPSAGKNRAHYRNQSAAVLLERASRESGRELRARDYRQLARIMLMDMPVVPLFHEDQVAVVRGRGRSFVPSADGRWSALANLQ